MTHEEPAASPDEPDTSGRTARPIPAPATAPAPAGDPRASASAAQPADGQPMGPQFTTGPTAADRPGGGSPPDPVVSRLARIEALLAQSHGAGGRDLVRSGQQHLVPAWRRVTRGETRWAATVSVLAVLGMQLHLPPRLAGHPQLLMPAVEFGLLLCLFALNPHRIVRRSALYRLLGLALTLCTAGANLYSAGRLVAEVVRGTDHLTAGALLVAGGEIWLINVVIFALAYWEWDRGGPAARAFAERDVPDFLFVQMQEPELAPPHWEPEFLDYFYLSFTNSTAFSPTDVMPVTRPAKALMLAQSAVSLTTVVLVVARAVNILG
ncbi:hypothetical protein [Actinacidiphila guanduensis]|uniref:hypothetical protein n=1 Tax=Actinacidiphila guanduensis TaxID=310781 RepID=UPI001FE5D09A|nr:hypothetical protein [Actinacidiphila guanduensis]